MLLDLFITSFTACLVILLFSAISDKEKLNSQNMLAVCPGNRTATDNNDKSCDAFRGSLTPKEQSMTVNPLNSNTLSEIRYKDDGIIFSDNPVIDDDLNNKLNLNCKTQMLPECRANALTALQEKVMHDNPNRTASKEYFEKLLFLLSSVLLKYLFVFWLLEKLLVSLHSLI